MHCFQFVFYTSKYLKKWKPNDRCFLSLCAWGWLDNSYRWENKCLCWALRLTELGRRKMGVVWGHRTHGQCRDCQSFRPAQGELLRRRVSIWQSDRCISEYAEKWKSESISHSILYNSLRPLWTVACQSSLSLGLSRQEYWVGSHSFLQRIFPTQRSNLDILHCRRILYHLSPQEGGPQPEKEVES